MYPEHEKLSAVAEASQAIGEFIDFGPYVLAEWVEDDLGHKYLVPVYKSINSILAEYFDIDLFKLEAEKRRMIQELQK